MFVSIKGTSLSLPSVSSVLLCRRISTESVESDNNKIDDVLRLWQKK